MELVNPYSDEALEMYRKGKLNKKKDRTVCVCGHPMSYHGRVGNIGVCTPAKGRCRCMKSRAILKTTNLRKFMYTTEGVGVAHALGKAIAACRADDVEMYWQTETGKINCDMCLTELLEPIPVAVNVSFDMPSNMSTGVDKIICMGCYTSWISE